MGFIEKLAPTPFFTVDFLRIARLAVFAPMSDQMTAIYRVLDANANRASEGMRVVEEYVRFVLDDRYLMTLCKEARHELAAALTTLNASSLLAARDTVADVGTTVSTPTELVRTDARAVAAASMKRLEQSLRSLEEYGKTVSLEFAVRCEQLRYRSYTLHRAIENTAESDLRLKDARLYVLVEGKSSDVEFRTQAITLIHAGVHVLQLRDKRLNDRELLQRARTLRELTHKTPTLFIMNDRADLAALSRADGVHVGQDELSVKDTRAIVGPQMLVGVSTHSLDQARQAVLDGANYIGCGPTFPSGTKQFNSFPGLAFLRSVADEIRLPAFAIGGITLDKVSEVLATGIGRVAVSGAIAKSVDPAVEVGKFLERL